MSTAKTPCPIWPERPLLNEIDTPSSTATELLLHAFSCAFPRPGQTRLYNLLTELQKSNLEHISEGPVEAARIGCLLDLGLPFRWMRRIDWRRKDGPIGMLEDHNWHGAEKPIESHIWFGDIFSSVAYQ